MQFMYFLRLCDRLATDEANNPNGCVEGTISHKERARFPVAHGVIQRCCFWGTMYELESNRV